jgi:cobalt-zinc-cadmium resistance protein CzcA
MGKIIDLSLRWRLLVIVGVALVAMIGARALQQLPIDAVPDVTNVQVQVLTSASGLGPLEIEKFITFPVETAMSGIPRVEDIRSISKFGLSVVTVVFTEGTDIYRARQLIAERLQAAKEAMPEGLSSPEMAPISTGLGEIYQFEVRGEGRSAMELRSILDWDIAFRLKSVPGVVEVNAFGGELKTYEVQIDPKRLVAYKIPLTKVFEAIEKNNANAGGAYIEKNQEQYLIRGEGLVESLQDVGNIVVETQEKGFPVYVKDLGQVAFAPMVRQGVVTRDGRGEAVAGIVMMLMGENSRAVVGRVKEKIEEIKKTLPRGVTIDTFYDRTDLVQKAIKTVTKNLLEGSFLVIAVLLILLGNFRGGLVVASAIPLSMLVAFIGMGAAGISGNLMSLGAIDFGLIVDGAVVMIENMIRHLAERQQEYNRPLTAGERFTVVRESCEEVARPVTFGVGIIMIVYIPILTLQGIEGKMFSPMAYTVIFALVGSLVLALTLMPVLGSLVFSGKVSEDETWLICKAKSIYEPLLKRSLAHPLPTASIAAGIFFASLFLIPFLGAEFVPKLDEGAIALQAWRLPSVALSETIHNTTEIERTLKEFPEVETVVSKSGRAEIATDPMGIEISDIFVMLKPHDQWKTAHTKEELVRAMDKRLDERIAGTVFSYSQPIEQRVSELISGVRSDVAVKIFGDDLGVLKEKADEVVRVLSKIRGAADTKAEQVSGLPVLRIKIDRSKISRYGINASDVLDTIRALGGKVLGQVLEGQKRFALQVRFNQSARSDPKALADIPVMDPRGRMIPLGQLADMVIEDGPAQISREDLHRRITVEANVRGRDLAGFVAEAQSAVALQVKLPSGYYAVWGGQFENLQRASKRLALVVPLTLFLIFLLLYTTFNSLRPALMIYLNIPLAATGGVIALFVRGLPFSISAGVGFIALFGVAVLNGVVLMTYITQLREQGMSPEEAAMKGAMIRLRPVLMTAMVASLGFIPMALATSAGAEVQRPLATVVIGGLITSTLLTLLVLPAIYKWAGTKWKEENGERN